MNRSNNLRIFTLTKKKPLINKADKMFSQYIRNRDGRCLKCGKQGILHCHHIISRSCKAVRWDEDNAISLCPGCHRNWGHANPLEVAEFMQIRLGIDEYRELILKASKPVPLTVNHYLEVIELLKQKGLK